MPLVAESAAYQFEQYWDLLDEFAFGQMSNEEFAARIRRRKRGTNENQDWEDE
jgi:hypothetical protein